MVMHATPPVFTLTFVAATASQKVQENQECFSSLRHSGFVSNGGNSFSGKLIFKYF